MKRISSPQRAAIYLRVSTDDQASGTNTSIDAQRAACRRFAAEQGLTVLMELSDEGKTGTNLERDGWRALLSAATAHLIDAVVVLSVSRLARGEVYHLAKAQLTRHKVSILSVTETFTDDLSGYMNEGLTALVNGIYPRQIGEWTAKKLDEMVLAGYHIGGPARFGYVAQADPGAQPIHLPGGKVKPAPKRLVRVEPAATQVADAFGRYARGDDMAAVGRYLESVTDETFAVDRVRRMLTCRLYLGESRTARVVNPASHPPIVSPEVFEAVAQRLASRERPTYVPKEDRVDPVGYYLRGHIFCAHCGRRMTPAGHHGARTKVGYYQCLKPVEDGKRCPIRRVNAGTVHAVVLAQIERLAAHPTRFDRLWRAALGQMSADDTRDQVARLRRNLRETGKKIRRIVETIKAGGSSPSLLRELRSLEALQARQEADLHSLRLSVSRVKPDREALCALWGRVTKLWEFLTPEERSEFLRLIVGPIRIVSRTEEGLVAQIPLLLGVEGEEFESGMGFLGDPSQLSDSKQNPLSNVERGLNMGAGSSSSSTLPSRFAVARLQARIPEAAVLLAPASPSELILSALVPAYGRGYRAKNGVATD